MLVHIGMGNIDIVHHTTLVKTNIITKKIEMYKTIMGLDKKGTILFKFVISIKDSSITDSEKTNKNRFIHTHHIMVTKCG